MRDLAAVSWQPASSSLIQRRSCLTAVAVGNAIVALGGHCGRAGARLTSTEMWLPNDTRAVKSQFQYLNGMSCPRSDHMAAAAPPAAAASSHERFLVL